MSGLTIKRLAWLPPLAALLLAWLLFLHHLDLESLWYDESISWTHAIEPSFGDLMARWPLGTGHPPLFFIWAWGWVHLTGESLFTMRFTAAIPMLLAVAFVYRLGYAWFKSRWVALGAMLFMATSGMVIYYAREMRMYALLMLLVLFSWWLLSRFLHGGRGATLAGYGVTVALMGYTHYLSALIPLAQGAATLMFYRHRVPKLLLGYLLAALLILPWIPSFLTQQEAASARAGREGSIGQFDGNEPTNFASIGEFVEKFTASQAAFVVALVVLALVLGSSTATRAAFRRNVGMTALWLFLPVAIMFAVNLVIPLYNPRYALPVIPALALLAGVAVGQLPARARLPLLAVIGVSGVLFHTTAFRPPKIPHNELLGTIYQRMLPGDRIWYNLSYGAYGSSIEEEVAYYLQVVYPELGGDEFIWEAPDDFASPEIGRVWDVRPYWIPMPPEAAQPLTATRSLSEEYIFGEYEVRLYEPPPAGEPLATFGDWFALVTGDIDTAYAPGETVTLKLWWKALQTISLDYSYGIYLRDAAGSVRAQVDSGMMLDDAPTSQWQVSDDYALATPTLTLPADLSPGDYELWLSVYYWETPQPLSIQGDANRIDSGASVYLLNQIRVEASDGSRVR